jgi:hypothetical protein
MRPASPRPPPPTPILRRMRRCGWRRTYHTDSTRNSQGITRREHLCALTFETHLCFVWFIIRFLRRGFFVRYGNGKGARDGSRCRALECHIEAESQSESIELNHTALLCIGGESRESGGLTGRSRRYLSVSRCYFIVALVCLRLHTAQGPWPHAQSASSFFRLATAAFKVSRLRTKVNLK